MPLVVKWLADVQAEIQQHGRVLTDLETKDALSVGVEHPQLIRVLTVDALNQPENPVLIKAGKETDLLGESAVGRTLGYGIEVVVDHYSRRLMRHELRHVYQFEQAGSLELFITDYIKSVLTDGYIDSAYEQDARAFEVVS